MGYYIAYFSEFLKRYVQVITENFTKFTTLRISDTYMLSKISTENWVAQWGPSVGQVKVVIIQGEVCCPSEKENRLNLQEPTRRLSKKRYIVDDVAPRLEICMI